MRNNLMDGFDPPLSKAICSLGLGVLCIDQIKAALY
jgi:hypothetical protein